MKIHSGMLLLALLFGLPARAADAVAVGQPAPAADATLLNGQRFSMSGARGEVVLMTFWATWCGPCRRELPVLDSYYRKHRAEGLRVIAISVDDPFDEAEVKKFTADFVFPVAMLNDASVAKYGRISAIPSSFLIDRRGIVRKNGWFDQPALAEADLERVVTPLLRAH